MAMTSDSPFFGAVSDTSQYYRFTRLRKAARRPPKSSSGQILVLFVDLLAVQIEPFVSRWHLWDMAALQRDSVSKDPPAVGLHELIEAHGDRLLRSAYLMCDDRAEAQDLVQETLLQAFKSAHRFRGDSEVYTWLHGILRNLCH